MQLKLDRSGGVTAFCGAAEIGQGSDDVLVACVAEVLGVDPMDVRAVTGDTDLTPVDLGSYSSRVTLMMGNAAIQAAERARDLLADAVSARLGVPRDRLVFAERRVFDAANPSAAIGFAEAVCLAEAKFGTIGTTGSYTPPRSAAKFKGGGVGPSPTYSYSAAIVEVDVDPDTGWIQVPRVWIAHDIGRALNPPLVRGQVEGSVYMAVSSYAKGTTSSGEVRLLKDLDTSLDGRHVVIVEDIVDTGLTLLYLQEILRARNPRSLRTACLLSKPSRRQIDVKVDYIGFTIEDRFVVGYGLDYAEQYRNLPHIAVLGGG